MSDTKPKSNKLAIIAITIFVVLAVAYFLLQSKVGSVGSLMFIV